MIDPTIVNLISNVGFPIVAFFYVVIRLEGKLERLIKAVEAQKA